jgi:hypothetical protein
MGPCGQPPAKGRQTLAALLLLVSSGTGCGPAFEVVSGEGNGPADADPPTMEGSAQPDSSARRDVGGSSDSNIAESSSDAAPRDALLLDAPVVHPDSGGNVDAARDAAPDVGGPCGPALCPPVLFECVPLGTGSGGGLTLSSLFSVAWRFQVPAGRTLTTTQAGLFYRPAATTGTLFAAIVPLASASTNPKAPLMPTDVLISGVVGPFNGIMPQIVTVPLSVKLVPGWYAVVFGTDQLGATGANGSAEKMNKAMMCSNGQYPMSLRPTGEVIVQSADPYLFVQTM